MHIHAQTQVERDRKAVRMFRGSDQHVAIATSITTSIATSLVIAILFEHVSSYRDGDHELFSSMVGAIGLGILSRPRADTQSPKVERVVHVDTTVFFDMSFRGDLMHQSATSWLKPES